MKRHIKIKITKKKQNKTKVTPNSLANSFQTLSLNKDDDLYNITNQMNMINICDYNSLRDDGLNCKYIGFIPIYYDINSSTNNIETEFTGSLYTVENKMKIIYLNSLLVILRNNNRIDLFKTSECKIKDVEYITNFMFDIESDNIRNTVEIKYSQNITFFLVFLKKYFKYPPQEKYNKWTSWISFYNNWIPDMINNKDGTITIMSDRNIFKSILQKKILNGHLDWPIKLIFDGNDKIILPFEVTNRFIFEKMYELYNDNI